MICNKCSEEKRDQFYRSDRTCKDCRKMALKEKRLSNPEYYKELDKFRYKNDPRVRDRHKAYSKTEKGKAAGNRAKKAWENRNVIKRAATVMVGNAVRDGKLTKPKDCEQCGQGGRIHGHHCDYSKPLEVMWLCGACHQAWHREHGEALNG